MNKKIDAIIKIALSAVILVNLILSIVILKNYSEIQYDINRIRWDINDIEDDMDKIEKSISELQDDVYVIKHYLY